MSPRRKRLRVRSKAALYAECVDDPTYGELLYETFGPRVIGFQISRHGDGMNFQRRPVRHGAIPVHTAGRSYLLELYDSLLQSYQVRIVDGPTTRRAYEQLGLETEIRESGIVYSWPLGQHDEPRHIMRHAGVGGLDPHH